MNNIVLIGRITRDLELKYTPHGNAVVNFSVAVDRDFSKEKITDFINVVTWNKSAENLAKYMKKGSLIGVVGSLQTRSYKDKEGNNRTVYEVLAANIQYLESKKDATEKEKQEEKQEDIFSQFTEVDDEDVPF